ncbi:MAG: hypothetical protein ACRDLO_15510, partial [Solirubrobacterales bacterium]
MSDLAARHPALAASRGGAAVTHRLAELAHGLRARGARVGVGELLGAHRALAAVDAADREQAYLALRAALCAGREDTLRFAEAFADCFGTVGADTAEPPIDPVATALLPQPAIPRPGAAELDRDDPAEVRPAAWSEVELLRDKDFAGYTAAERALARTVLA